MRRRRVRRTLDHFRWPFWMPHFRAATSLVRRLHLHRLVPLWAFMWPSRSHGPAPQRSQRRSDSGRSRQAMIRCPPSASEEARQAGMFWSQESNGLNSKPSCAETMLGPSTRTFHCALVLVARASTLVLWDVSAVFMSQSVRTTLAFCLWRRSIEPCRFIHNEFFVQTKNNP